MFFAPCPPCLRSLELFFATNQSSRSAEHVSDKSPRLCRKFSSPPPLSISSRTSSPIHTRKLSLSSPVSVRVGALDLSITSPSGASSPTSTCNPSMSPPPSCTKAPLDLSRGPSSPEHSPGILEEGAELPRIDAFCGKLRRSIRRGRQWVSVSVTFFLFFCKLCYSLLSSLGLSLPFLTLFPPPSQFFPHHSCFASLSPLHFCSFSTGFSLSDSG